MASGKQGRNRSGSISFPQPHHGAPKQATDQDSAKHDPRHLKPKSFLDTGLGGLAPEIRELIFINLLAVPPPFGGRDLRVERTSVVDQPPIALTSFVELKASCLTVLQTCRQIYHEACPLFYASKAYYIANSNDLRTFHNLLNRRLSITVPCSFRGDTITSICLKDLVTKIPEWTVEWTPQYGYTVAMKPGPLREELGAATEQLDPFMTLIDFDNMKSLRRICLCMRVGQELKYLQFLFRIKGLGRGVVNFVDNFHWTIRSQSMLEGEWQIQYSLFSREFYLKGKNFEDLKYIDALIQQEILDTDSRASDLDEGDERWVEVDVGIRDYGDRTPEQQDAPGVVANQESENLQGPPNGGGVYSPTKEGSNYELGHLLSPSQDGTDPPPAKKHTGQEPEDLQVQPNEGNVSPESALYHPGQRRDDLQSMKDGADPRIQAELNQIQDISTPDWQPNDKKAVTLDQTALKEGSDDLQDIINRIKNLRIS